MGQLAYYTVVVWKNDEEYWLDHLLEMNDGLLHLVAPVTDWLTYDLHNFRPTLVNQLLQQNEGGSYASGISPKALIKARGHHEYKHWENFPTQRVSSDAWMRLGTVMACLMYHHFGGENVGVFTRDFRQRMNTCRILITVPSCLEILMLSPASGEFVQSMRYLILDEVHCMNGEACVCP
eukprot:1150973-Pelagomonas_calceolata.AAC.8